MQIHRLSDIDSVAKTGVCSECGPVEVRFKKRPNGRIQYRCGTYQRQYSAAYDKNRKPRERSEPSWHRRKEPHGLTWAQAREFRQGKPCAICGELKERMVVDHDHTKEHLGTASIRGVLCHECNVALGWMHDDPDILHAAFVYLATSYLA